MKHGLRLRAGFFGSPPFPLTPPLVGLGLVSSNRSSFLDSGRRSLHISLPFFSSGLGQVFLEPPARFGSSGTPLSPCPSTILFGAPTLVLFLTNGSGLLDSGIYRAHFPPAFSFFSHFLSCCPFRSIRALLSIFLHLAFLSLIALPPPFPAHLFRALIFSTSPRRVFESPPFSWND